MRGSLVMLLLASLLASHGCAKTEPPGQKGGLEIHAPGVDIKINKQDGVNVKAPGTEVHAGQGKGVDVKAPGVDVEVKPQQPDPDSDQE